MIDTDKYEGHTPGPWSFGEDWLLLAEETFDCETVCSDLSDATEVDAQLMADAPLLLEEVKRAREIVPKLSRLIGVKIPWIEHDHPITNGIFIGEAVEWNYDGSGEWVLVNYNETRWVSMSYIEAHNVSKYREQVGLKELIE